MGSNQSGYQPDEIDAIAKWLQDGLSAAQIAAELSHQRRAPISRNAIIGIVHRNNRLKQIGFGRERGQVLMLPQAKTPDVHAPVVRPAKQNLNAGNIRGKKLGRAFDRPLSVPLRVVDALPPAAYDAASKHLPLEDLGRAQCRWPVNDAPQGGQHLFCGEVTGSSADGERSYCPHHCRRAVGAGTPAERHAPRQLLRLTA